MIGGVVADLGPALTGLAAVLTAAAAFWVRKGAKGAQKASESVVEAVGRPNGNGPANDALHVVIEMLKFQQQELTHISETVSASGAQLDELTLIVRDHMQDTHAHGAGVSV